MNIISTKKEEEGEADDGDDIYKKHLQTLTLSTPISVTILPRQLRKETAYRHRHIINSPCYDQVVVQHDDA